MAEITQLRKHRSQGPQKTLVVLFTLLLAVLLFVVSAHLAEALTF